MVIQGQPSPRSLVVSSAHSELMRLMIITRNHS